MHTMLKFRCPNCNVGLEAKEEKAGRSYDCPSCKGWVTVPAPQALVPMPRPVAVPEIIDDWKRQRKLARRKKRRDDNDKPVELRLGNYAGMKVDVDRKTRSVMATTFLGGLLALLGVIVAIVFGGKSKSS